MSEYKDKIIGSWENDSLSYVFEENGNLTINWININISKTGSWSIENDKINFKYGENLHITWEGSINHITDKELSITDESHQKGVIDKFFRKDLSIIEPTIDNINNISPTQAKKKFKDKVTETFWGVIGLAFLVALIGGFGYLISKGFQYESHQYNYFVIGTLLFVASAILLILTLYKGSDHDALFLKGFFTFYASFIVVPLLYIVLVVFFKIITLWYYLLVLGVIIALIMLALKTELKWIYKSVIILISIASMYFLYDAKSILKIKFEVYFNDTNVGSSSDVDE